MQGSEIGFQTQQNMTGLSTSLLPVRPQAAGAGDFMSLLTGMRQESNPLSADTSLRQDKETATAPVRKEHQDRAAEPARRIAAEDTKDRDDMRPAAKKKQQNGDETGAPAADKAEKVRLEKDAVRKTGKQEAVENEQKKKLLVRLKQLLEKALRLLEEKATREGAGLSNQEEELQTMLLVLLDLFSNPEHQENAQELEQAIRKTLRFLKQGMGKQGAEQQSRLVETQINLQELVQTLEKALVHRSKPDQQGKDQSVARQDSNRPISWFEKQAGEDGKTALPVIEVTDHRKQDARRLEGRLRVRRNAAAKMGSRPNQEVEQAEWDAAVAATRGESKTQFNPVGQDRLAESGRRATVIKNSSRQPELTRSREMFQQIVERARVTLKSGMSEMKVQLRPKHLGRIRMQFLLKDGNLTARISVANEGLRQFLGQNLDNLGQELQDAGINLTGMEIEQDNAGSGFADLLASREQEKKTALALNGKGAQVSSTGTTVPAGRKHSGLVDLVA